MVAAIWPGSSVFGESDCRATGGGDETFMAIRAQLPVKTRFFGYGHRVSFSFVAGEDLFGLARGGTGCVATQGSVNAGCSPSCARQYTAGREFRWRPQKCSRTTGETKSGEPRGELSPEECRNDCTASRYRRSARVAHSPETTRLGAARILRRRRSFTKLMHLQCWVSTGLFIKSVADLTTALQGADDIRSVSTVGISV